jgi:hypothetical protein
MEKKKRTWDMLVNWLADVSKYLMTGILLTSVFKDIEDKIFLYTISLGLSVGTLLLAVILKNKNKED